MSKADLWKRYCETTNYYDVLGMSLDISRMNFTDAFFDQMTPSIQKAFNEMDALEAGAITNVDEERMVGHYWLRNGQLAPSVEIREAVDKLFVDMDAFAEQVHSGKVRGQGGRPFKHLLLIGIGGSSLGPHFVNQALGTAQDKMTFWFINNTDPDGMDRTLSMLEPELDQTLTLVISKSGGTVETRNGMLETIAAYQRKGLNFAKHAVAATGDGSKLHKQVMSEGWLACFPLWDWVGGRTSEFASVGMLPAKLQGIDIQAMVEGARLMDNFTRVHDAKKNPAMLLALMWHYAGNGKGDKAMVVLPYKDRLELFSRYLQQLVMESLGKELDLDGNRVEQGLAVYGNKGSTDQHAFVQQLREGRNDFFVTFIEVLKDRFTEDLEVEPGVTSGDYLQGFYLGTRQALHENGRESITITLDAMDPKHIGALIALFERAVGYYAFLVNINAYHQPGVEAGKKAAGAVITLQKNLLEHLKSNAGQARTLSQLAESLGAQDEIETLHKVLQHLSANGRVSMTKGAKPEDSMYQLV